MCCSLLRVITTIAFFEAVIFGLFILVVGSGQVSSTSPYIASVLMSLAKVLLV